MLKYEVGETADFIRYTVRVTGVERDVIPQSERLKGKTIDPDHQVVRISLLVHDRMNNISSDTLLYGTSLVQINPFQKYGIFPIQLDAPKDGRIDVEAVVPRDIKNLNLLFNELNSFSRQASQTRLLVIE